MSGPITQALLQLNHALEESGIPSENVGLVFDPKAYSDFNYALCREVGPLKWATAQEDVCFMGFKVLRSKARPKMTNAELLDMLKERLK